METKNSLDVLSSVSGLSKDEMHKIWQEVKANHAKLNECDYHEFVLVPGDNSPILTKRKYVCTHCGGVIDGMAHKWHEQGRKPKPQSLNEHGMF